jgi:hypothetical protein
VPLTLLLIVLTVLVAYYFLGTPLLDFIHKFTKEFTQTFPLWSFLLPGGAAPATRPGSHHSPAPRGTSSTPGAPPRR